MLTADLGWCMARCQLAAEGCELTIVSPASAEEPAQCFVLDDRLAILELRDLIQLALEQEADRAQLSAASEGDLAQ